MPLRSLPNMSIRLALMAISMFSVLSPLQAAADEPDYHVVARQHLDGDLKWDYLTMDAHDRRLFITHGDRVEVFDVDQQKIVGTITHTPGVHGVALAPDLDRGYTSNGKADTVTIFALSTLKVIGSVPTGKKPDAIVYDALSQRVFTGNGKSGSLTPIGARAGKPLAAIALGGKPEFMAVDGNGRLFVNLEDKNQLVVVDTRKLQVIRRIDLAASCDEPAGLSIDLSTQRLFIGCHNQKMVMVDAQSGEILDTVTIGSGSDATAFDATAKLAFSSNSDGTLDVIEARDASHYQRRQSVPTMTGARTMAVDPVTHKVFLLSAEAAATDLDTTERTRFIAGTLTLVTVSP